MNRRIKIIREALHLSQREFGEPLGVSRDVISNLEYGRVQPKERLIKQICNLYHVNPHWINTGEGPIFHSDPRAYQTAAEAEKIFQALRPEFQDYALEQLRLLSRLQSTLRQYQELPMHQQQTDTDVTDVP